MGHFPWDIVVLAVLAAFLGGRFFRVLGRRVGAQCVRTDRPEQERTAPASNRLRPPPLPNGAVKEPPKVERDIPSAASPVGHVLAQIGALDPAFSPALFLDDVEKLFGQIVRAYAKGDRGVLEAQLTAEANDVFREAIEKRVQAGEIQQSDLQRIERLSIRNASLELTGADLSAAQIEVGILSWQINLLKDAENNIVHGTEAVTEFNDIWVFSRDYGVAGAQWRLASARPA